MKKNDFNKAVKAAIDNIVAMDLHVESFIPEWESHGIDPKRVNIFGYGAASEYFFENFLEKMCGHSGYKRKTTFSQDFSFAEWFTGEYGLKKTVLDTFKRSVGDWHNDIEYMAELIMAVNTKSWEHAQRGNVQWSKVYAELYYAAKDLYFEWFDESHPKHEEAMSYYFYYVD